MWIDATMDDMLRYERNPVASNMITAIASNIPIFNCKPGLLIQDVNVSSRSEIVQGKYYKCLVQTCFFG